MREAYKPLRNMARTFAFDATIDDIWHYLQHLSTDSPLPDAFERGLNPSSGQPFDLRYMLPPFKFELMLREIILHAGQDKLRRSLRRWKDLASLANELLRYSELTGGYGDDGTTPLMDTLHRLGHQQMPWQREQVHRELIRTWLVYGTPAMEPIMLETTGLTIRQYTILAYSAASWAMRSPRWRVPPGYFAPAGISDDQVTTFLHALSKTIAEHRGLQRQAQKLELGWEYTWNPVREYPLIFDAPGSFVCPIVAHLIKRVTSGLYFDVCRGTGFSETYGKAIDAYIGLALVRGHPTAPPHKVAPYGSANKRKHGSDWIVSDPTGNVFVECKGKRLLRDARSLENPVALARDLDTLADAIVQNYRNIADAEAGLTDWVPNELPTFSLVVTLDDWVLFSHGPQDQLHALVLRKAVAADLAPMVTRIPYFYASAADTEELALAWGEAGIDQVMRRKSGEEHRRSMMSPFIQNHHTGAIQAAGEMFEPERAAMMRAIELELR